MTTTHHRTIDLFATRASEFTRILNAADGRWDAPSPCEGWTVRDVVRHVVDTERDFLTRHDLATGEAPDLADPATGWHQHAQQTLATLSQDGVADRTFDGYFGPTTVGQTMAEFYGWDLVIHGWDVARATGQDWSISEEQARALGADADGWGPALYSEGICRPAVEVPADASEQDRLLARLGRAPQWAPHA